MKNDHCVICERSLAACQCKRCPSCHMFRDPHCVERHAPREFWQDCTLPALPEHMRRLHDDTFDFLYWFDDVSRRWIARALNATKAQYMRETASRCNDNIITCVVDLNAHRRHDTTSKTDARTDANASHVQASFI